MGNSAKERGGGIYAVSSLLRAYTKNTVDTRSYTGSSIQTTENSARLGGGICLEMNAKMYILKKVNKYILWDARHVHVLKFTNNMADYGGAIYVADDTNSGTCASTSYRSHAPTTECFFQTVTVLTFHLKLHFNQMYLDQYSMEDYWTDVQ